MKPIIAHVHDLFALICILEFLVDIHCNVVNVVSRSLLEPNFD